MLSCYPRRNAVGKHLFLSAGRSPRMDVQEPPILLYPINKVSLWKFSQNRLSAMSRVACALYVFCCLSLTIFLGLTEVLCDVDTCTFKGSHNENRILVWVLCLCKGDRLFTSRVKKLIIVAHMENIQESYKNSLWRATWSWQTLLQIFYMLRLTHPLTAMFSSHESHEKLTSWWPLDASEEVLQRFWKLDAQGAGKTSVFHCFWPILQYFMRYV